MPRPPAFLESDAGASLAIALSGAFWGLFWIPLRALERQGFAGNWANVTLYGAASLALLPFLYLRGRPRRRDLPQLIVIGIFSGLGFALWNNALIYGAVVRVTLLFYLTPVMYRSETLAPRASTLRAIPRCSRASRTRRPRPARNSGSVSPSPMGHDGSGSCACVALS